MPRFVLGLQLERRSCFQLEKRRLTQDGRPPRATRGLHCSRPLGPWSCVLTQAFLKPNGPTATGPQADVASVGRVWARASARPPASWEALTRTGDGTSSSGGDLCKWPVWFLRRKPSWGHFCPLLARTALSVTLGLHCRPLPGAPESLPGPPSRGRAGCWRPATARQRGLLRSHRQGGSLRRRPAQGADQLSLLFKPWRRSLGRRSQPPALAVSVVAVPSSWAPRPRGLVPLEAALPASCGPRPTPCHPTAWGLRLSQHPSECPAPSSQ